MNYLHPDAQIFLDSTRDAPQLDTQTPGKNRQDQLQASSSWGTKTELASVFDSTVRGVNVRVYIPEAAEKTRSEEHTSELQSRGHLVCRLLLEKKKHWFFLEQVI